MSDISHFEWLQLGADFFPPTSSAAAYEPKLRGVWRQDEESTKQKSGEKSVYSRNSQTTRSPQWKLDVLTNDIYAVHLQGETAAP